MPDYFLKKKSLLDRFKDNHGRTGYIQSARAEHTWSNPIKRNRRTKELNGWIKSFAGKKHIRKLARFNTLNNGKNEGYNMENFDCLRYGSTLELPNGVCIPVNAPIRCPRRAPFTFRITDIHEAEAGNPSKYVIRGYYPVYGPEQKPSDEFDIPCNDVSDIEQWIKTNENGNSMQNEAMSLKGFIENLTEELTKQFDLDEEEVKNYLDTHTQEMQELLDDKDLSLKEKVLFVRSEITGEKDEARVPAGDDTLYIVQGVDAFTDFTYAFTQDELKHIKDHWSETDWRVKIAKLLFGADYENELSENPDILDEVADSTEIGTKQELLELNYPEHLFEAKEPTEEKLGYEKGHKNSKGEDAPWVIRSHEDNRILASFANKKDAEAHLKRMKQYSKTEKMGENREDWVPCILVARNPIANNTNYCYNLDGDWTPHEDNAYIFKTVRSAEQTAQKFVDKLQRGHVDGFAAWTTKFTSVEPLEVSSSKSEDLEIYACYIEFASESDAKTGMELVKSWHPTISKNLVVVEGLSKSAAEYLWKDWLDKCTDAELDIKDKGEVYKDSIDATNNTKSEAHDIDTYKSDVFSDLVVNLFHGEDGAKKLVDEYADAIKDAFARGDTSMEIATEIDTMAGKHESKDVSLKEIARTLDTAINKDGNYSVKDNTSGVTATDKDRTQTIKVSKDLKVELEDTNGKHSYEAQSLRDLSKYIRRAVKGEYVNEDFHKTQVKDAVYDVINRHNLNNAVKVSYLGNSVVCKYADRTLRIQPDLLTTMSTKDGDNVDTYPTNLKELDGYLDRVFGHYADELAESKQSEGLKLDYVDTITVPQWLWEAYLLGNEYGGDLTDDEQTILYDFKEKYKDCHLDDRGEEPDFHSRNDFDCYGGNCYVVDVYTKTDVKEKKSEKLFNKQELEALARGADILDQLQYRFSFSFYSPKTYTDAVDTALAMDAEDDKRIAHETIGDSEFRLYTDDPYDAIRFRDGLSNRAGIPAEDLASTFRSAVGIRKNGGFATEDEQDTIGRYAAENYVSFSVSEDNSTMYVEGELPNVVEFFEAIGSAEPA